MTRNKEQFISNFFCGDESLNKPSQRKGKKIGLYRTDIKLVTLQCDCTNNAAAKHKQTLITPTYILEFDYITRVNTGMKPIE